MVAVQVLRQDLTQLPHQLARLDEPFPSRFYDFGSWHLSTLHQPVERPPGITALLTAPIEPLVEQPAHLVLILTKALTIADHSIIVPVPAHFGRQRFPYRRQLPMAMGSQPFPHPLNCTLELLARSPSFHRRASLPIRFPAIFKSQEVKPPIILPAVAAKTNRLGLLRSYFQPLLRQPLRECPLKCRRFVPILEARHKVVRKAEQPALASIPFPHRCLVPLVQDLVQIHVGQHGRDDSPLRRAQFGMHDSPIFFQYAGLQPLAD